MAAGRSGGERGPWTARKGRARRGPVPRPLRVFTAVPRAPGRGGHHGAFTDSASCSITGVRPAPLAPPPPCPRAGLVLLSATPFEREDVGIRIRSKTAENKIWEGTRAAASEAGRDGENPFFASRRRCTVPARGAARPNGRGEATPFRPKTARESYSKARPSAARFRRSGGQRHPYAFLNTLIKRPCERYFFVGARV